MASTHTAGWGEGQGVVGVRLHIEGHVWMFLGQCGEMVEVGDAVASTGDQGDWAFDFGEPPVAVRGGQQAPERSGIRCPRVLLSSRTDDCRHPRSGQGGERCRRLTVVAHQPACCRCAWRVERDLALDPAHSGDPVASVVGVLIERRADDHALHRHRAVMAAVAHDVLSGAVAVTVVASVVLVGWRWLDGRCAHVVGQGFSRAVVAALLDAPA